MYQGNILFVRDGSPEGSASAHWLCEWPCACLNRAGYFADMMNYQDVPSMSREQRRAADRADVIVYERHVDDPWLPFLEWAASTKRLMLTLDDAYWLSHPSTPTFHFWSQNDRLHKLETVAAWAERVVAPSRKLAAHFGNGHFKPNRPDLLDPRWTVNPLFSDGPSICWGGTMGHIAGLMEHPFLEAVSAICGRKDARFVGVGGSPELMALLETVPNSRVVPMQQTHDWLSILSASTIVACPIGEGYDEHRSWIKALEASLTGSVWVASNRGVYDGARGGILVDDTPEAWEEAMMGLLQDTERRNALMEEGRIWAWQQGLADHLDEWEEILNE